MSEDEKPEGLDEFIKNVFGSQESAEEFSEGLEAVQMQEAWKGIYEVYLGMKSGGFSTAQANAILGSYLYHLISGIEGGN